MAVTQKEREIITDLNVKGYTADQIGGVIKELRRRDQVAKAQAEYEKKHKEEVARIEAERKKEKEENAIQAAFTFTTPGTETKEEEEPQPGIGVLVPEVELTKSEKNKKLIADNEAEHNKRQNTSLTDWYKNVLVPNQTKTNPQLKNMLEKSGWAKSFGEGERSWEGFLGRVDFAKYGIKEVLGTAWDIFGAITEDEDPYENSMYRQLGLKEPGDDFTLAGVIKEVDIEGIPDTKRFWGHVGIDLETEYNAWKNEKSTELPKNIFETPSYEDYVAVDIPGGFTEYKLPKNIESNFHVDDRAINAEQFNKLKEKEESEKAVDDPALNIYKKQKEEEENKDFKFYEDKYKEALENNDAQTAKHYFHKIKETNKESEAVPSNEKLAGEISKYFELKKERQNWGPSERDNVGRQLDEKIKNSSNFLNYYSEEEAEQFLENQKAKARENISDHVFSQEEIEASGIDPEDFKDFFNNRSQNRNNFNFNYNVDFDSNGDIAFEKTKKVPEEIETLKADALNGYLNEEINELGNLYQTYDNLGIVKDIEYLNTLQLEMNSLKNNEETGLLDKKIKEAKEFAHKLQGGIIKNTDENVDKLSTLNAEVEVLSKEFNDDVNKYNEYFEDETKSKLIDGYGDLARRHTEYQKRRLLTLGNNDVLKEQFAKAQIPNPAEVYSKNPTLKNGAKLAGAQVLDIAEEFVNFGTNFVTGVGAFVQTISGEIGKGIGYIDSETVARKVSSWTNLQDQYLNLNYIDFGPMMNEDGSVNGHAVPAQLVRTVADIFAMARGTGFVKGGIRGIGKGGKYITHKVGAKAGVRSSTLDNLFDASRRRVLAPITKKAVDLTSQYLGVMPIIFPMKFREAMSQVDDDFTYDDALTYTWKAASLESAIEMINPDIKMMNRWKQFKKKDATNWKLWKDGSNITKVGRIFAQNLSTVPAELIEENLQEFYGGQLNMAYNRLYDTEFHIPTESDYKAVNMLTPMAVMIAGAIRTKGFRQGDRSRLAQGALEDLPAFEKELGKQVELYESTNGKEGVSPDEYGKIMEEVVLYGTMKNKIGAEVLNDLTPEEQYDWIQLMAQKEKLQAQIKDPKIENKEQLQGDLDTVNKRMKDLSRHVQMTSKSIEERQLDAKIKNLENELKDTETYPPNTPESLAIIEEIEKARKQRNKVRQETPLYSFNNKAYDTEEELLDAIEKARANGFFKTNKHPRIKINNKVPNANEVKEKAYEAMGEDAPDINNYSGRQLMSEEEVAESEAILNNPDYFGKTVSDLENDLIEEQDPAKRSEIEQAIQYLKIKDRGYTLDPKTGSFVMTGKDIDFSRGQALALERYTKAAAEVAEAAGARAITMDQAQIDEYIRQGILDPEVRDANGFFMQDINEAGDIVGYMWVVNKDAAIEFGQSVTATHEMLHGVLWSVLNGPTRTIKDPQGNDVQVQMTEEGKKLLKGFLKLLPQKYIDVLNQKLDNGGYRFNEYDKNGVGVKGTERAFEQYGEEYLNMFHEAVVNDKAIPLEENKSLFRKIIDWFNSFFKEETNNELTNIDIKTPEELMQFMKTYNAQAIKGKFDDQIKELAKRSYEQYREDKPGMVMLSKSASDNVQRIYEEQGVGGALDIIEQFKPITNKIVEKRREAPGFDKQLLTDEIETGKRGILDLIQEYDPASGVPLAAYINKFLPSRAIEASRRVLGEEFTEDVAERVDVATEEVVTEVKAKPKPRKIILSDRLGVKNKVDKAIKQKLPELDIEKLNFKTLKDQAPEVTGEMFGISPKKLVSLANITKKELQSAQMFINKNADVLISMLPEGATTGGTATGVPKTLLKEFYTKSDRAKMAKTGTKAGLAIQVKNPNITKKQFLEVFGIIDGKPDRTDRNTSARVLALANLTGKMMTNQAVRQELIAQGKPVQALRHVADGKAVVMFSQTGKQKHVGGITSPLQGNKEAEIEFLERIPIWSEFFGSESTFSLDKNAIKTSLKYVYSDVKAVMDNIDNITDAIYTALEGKKLPKTETLRQSEIENTIFRSNERSGKKLATYFRVNESFRDIQSNKDRVERARDKTKQYALERWEELNEKYKDDPELAAALWCQEMREIEKHSTSSARIADKRFIPDPNNPIKVIPNPEYANLQKKRAKKGKTMRYGGQAWGGVNDFRKNIMDLIKDENGKPAFKVEGKAPNVKVFYKGKNISDKTDFNTKSQTPASVIKDSDSETAMQTRKDQITQIRESLNNYIKWQVEQWKNGSLDNADLLFVASSLISNMNTMVATAAMPGWVTPDVRKILNKIQAIEKAYKNGSITKKQRDKKIKNLEDTLIYEHMLPRVNVVINMFDAHINGDGIKNVNDFLSNYEVAIIPSTMDQGLKDAKVNEALAPNQTMQDPAWYRYYFERTFGDKRMRYLIGIGKNKGKTAGEEWVQANELIIPRVKEYTTFHKALQFSKSVNNPTKGMSAWDFDDTVARTKSGVIAKIPNTSGNPKPGRKVIFLAGGAGSGKSNVVKQLDLENQGFKIVNQDISLEWLKKNSGLPADMKDLTSEQLSKLGKLQWEARKIAARKQMKFKGRGDGIIVDGTGASMNVMKKQVQEFKDAGYEVQMLFVETSLETAIERNAARKERTLRESIVRKNHEKVQGNKEGFRELFGNNFAEVKTDNLKIGDPMPQGLVNKINSFTTDFEVRRLTAEEFATEGSDILEQGGEFDFREFDVVTKGEKGPLFGKAMDRAKKYGLKDNYILTARPHAAKKPIYEFLKSQGLEIPLDNIVTLENSTPEAKALWIAEKVGEGYNDVYFADDALQNVQAVDNMMNQFDIKSKVQQAKIQFSKGASKEFNEMLEGTKGLPSEYKISQAKARQRGKKVGRFKLWIPPSADDFAGLLQMFQGKGEQGMKDAAWLKEHLLDPFARGDRSLNGARQRTAEEFKALRKKFPKVSKKLRKVIPTGDYTFGDAIRVYLWDKNGIEIPGLSKTDQAAMVELVKGDPELQAFADVLGVLSRKEDGYIAPDEYWMTKDIVADITEDGIIGDGRKEHLAEWIENKDLIFTPENLNKIEFLYGSNFREALEDILYRMENGSNRPTGSNRIVNNFLNWLNGGISVVMNWNTRSALLQTLSTVNFINWGDNNMLAAAKAFANQKQFWTDFAYIFNSDMLRQRRAGLKTTIESNELMSEVEGAVNPVRAAIRYLLRVGFTPTKIADSFAIAMGGSSFYRNRIKTYEKQGYSTAEAEAKAWLDFQETAEEAQQSSRPDRISMQQASVLGRIILAFQNTPMQYMRMSKKEVLDLVNGRYVGMTGENSVASKVGKILYYTAVQNLIFYTMQTALFAAMFDDDEDDEEFFNKKREMVANNMADGVLRGLGVSGAVVSTIKNIILKYIANKDSKMYDESAILMEALKLSPPLSIKARQILSADKTMRYNRDVIKEMETFDIDNPMWNAVFNVVEMTTNAPLSRMESKYKNVRDALNNEYELWQRVAFMLGYNKWSLGLKDKEIEEIKKEIKAIKTFERKKKAQEKKQKEQAEAQSKVNKKIEKEKELQEKGILKDPKCRHVSSKGERCNISVAKAGDLCTVHEEKPQRVDGKKVQCKKVKKDGKRCKMQTSNKSGYCYYHD